MQKKNKIKGNKTYRLFCLHRRVFLFSSQVSPKISENTDSIQIKNNYQLQKQLRSHLFSFREGIWGFF